MASVSPVTTYDALVISWLLKLEMVGWRARVGEEGRGGMMEANWVL